MAAPRDIEIPDLVALSRAPPAFPLPARGPLYNPPPPNLLSIPASPPPAPSPPSSDKIDVIEVVTDNGLKGTASGDEAASTPAQDSTPPSSFMDLFRFASAGDKVMIVSAFICAVLHGAALPAFSYVFGEFMDTTGSVSPDELLGRVSFLAGIMVAIGGFAFVASGLWTALFAYSSQRQGARIRTIYLASIIGKDCAW